MLAVKIKASFPKFQENFVLFILFLHISVFKKIRLKTKYNFPRTNYKFQSLLFQDMLTQRTEFLYLIQSTVKKQHLPPRDKNQGIVLFQKTAMTIQPSLHILRFQTLLFIFAVFYESRQGVIHRTYFR